MTTPDSVPPTIGPFKVCEQIGSGANASVYRAYNEAANLTVAIKVFDLEKLDKPELITRFNREISLLKQIDHPLVSSFVGEIRDEKKCYMIIEYCDSGSMHNFVRTNGKLMEQIARRYFIQLIAVLDYLHRVKRIAHRDLKLENVLLDKYFNIRLIDFGLSNLFQDDLTKFNSQVGSPAYVPPEIIKGEPYTKSADIWSAGVLLFAITNGCLPFLSSDYKELANKVLFATPEFSSNITSMLKDLLLKMLEKQPDKRITLEEIKQHPWFWNGHVHIDMFYSEVSAQNNVNDPNFKPNENVIKTLESLSIDTKDLTLKLRESKDDNDAVILYRALNKQTITENMRSVLISRPNSKLSRIKGSTPDVRKINIMEDVNTLSCSPKIDDNRSIQVERNRFVRPVAVRPVANRVIPNKGNVVVPEST